MMHDGEVPIDQALAKRLIETQFPRFRGLPVAALAGAGTDNVIFRIGDRAAARFRRRAMDPAECSALLLAEAEAMSELAENCSVPSPRPLGLGRPGLSYPLPFSVQTWIAGDVATPDGLAASDEFARDIARLIAGFRRADTRGRPFGGKGRGGRLADHDDWMAVCFEKSDGLLDVARLRALWDRFRLLPPAATLVMNHKDLIPGNLLVRYGRLFGVLDGGGFGPADPALDLVAGWYMLDRERRMLLRRHLGCDDAEWQRGAAWAFQQAMGLVWYYRRTAPAMARLGESTLGRLLEDLSSS